MIHDFTVFSSSCPVHPIIRGSETPPPEYDMTLVGTERELWFKYYLQYKLSAN